jgi:hypothetical protein
MQSVFSRAEPTALRSSCDALADGSESVPRRGRIVMRGGMLAAVRRRAFGRRGSSFRIWCDAHFPRGCADCCWLDYRGTRRRPGFLTLEYVRSGPRTSLASFAGALHVLDRIAELREAQAIFAHVGTSAISDRLLRRWGWERHAERLGGRQWVKRFYNGYPSPNFARYLPESSIARNVT